MISTAHYSRFAENQILAALDKTEYQHLFLQLERVPLVLGERIYEAEGPMDHVYSVCMLIWPNTSDYSTFKPTTEATVPQRGKTQTIQPDCSLTYFDEHSCAWRS
jgi:hypothetical protein